jgi:parallel beta-helix repeat protein
VKITLKHFSFLVILTLTICIGVQTVNAEAMDVICISPNNNSSTGGIQEAINALPERGGVILLQDGVYSINESIIISKDNVTIRGSSNGAVIKRSEPINAMLINDLREIEQFVMVDNPTKFEVGMSIVVRDGMYGGWNSFWSKISAIDQYGIYLTDPAPRSYETSRYAYITTYSPVIYVKNANNIVLDNLVFMSKVNNIGEFQKELGPDFTDSCVLIELCSNTLLTNLTIRNSSSDGIGIQRGENIVVRNCLVENAELAGIHLGTAVKGGSLISNTLRQNSKGIDFCAYVQGFIVSMNEIYNNDIGIWGLGAVGDRNNIIYGNTIFSNLLFGIGIYEEGNTVINNKVYNNGPHGQLNVNYFSNDDGNIVLVNQFDDYFVH